MPDTKMHILYIDDDDDDRSLVKQVIERRNPKLELKEAQNGQEGIDYLKAVGSSRQLPCLVILDLNMPGMNGRETLLAMRKDPMLAKIPVVIFTTSSSMLDKTFCDRHGVDMVTKPLTFESLHDSIERMLKLCSTP